MTLVNIPPQIIRPLIEPGGALFTVGSFQLNAVGDKVTFIFRAPKAGVIDGALFNIVTASTTTKLDMKTTLQGVTGTPTPAPPDGSVAATSSIVTPSGTGQFVTTGMAATVTAGQLCAMELSADTLFVGDITIGTGLSVGINPSGFPYGFTKDTAGSYTVIAPGGPLTMGLIYSGSDIVPVEGYCPFSTFSEVSFANNDGSNDEHALRFVPVFACRLIGAYAMGQPMLGDSRMRAYDGTTTLLTGMDVQTDKDQLSVANRRGDFFRFPGSAVLTAGSTYYLGIRPTTTTAIKIAELTVDNTAYLAALMGTGWYLGKRNWTTDTGTGTDPGTTFTDTNTTLPLIFPVIDQLDDGAGGAGVTSNLPAMTRGLTG